MRQLFLGAIGLGLAISSGCAREEGSTSADLTEKARPRAAVKLTLLVVGDPELAAGASSLRGEWAERSGGELIVEQLTLEELLAAEQISADAIVYPSRFVGTLVARNWLRPVRDSVLKSDRFALGDLLPLVRNESMRYGGKVIGISLGEPPMLLAWQSSSEQEVLVSEADTWEKFDRLSSLEVRDVDLATELIVRAASGIDRRRRSELLFDPQSMSPRLKTPPMVRALDRIVARTKPVDGSEIRVRFTYPTAGDLGGEPLWRFKALPFAATVFDSLRDRWQPQATDESVTVLGFSGRLVSVTSSTKNSSSAFKLIAWLTSGKTATQLSSRSQATLWSRISQRQQANRWIADRADDELFELITRQLSSDNYYVLPRIPGIDRYLRTLNTAVAQAVQGKATPAEALEAATSQWNALTESLGQKQQRQAYRWHLGLGEVSD